jgi:tripeptide aminopeptidase
MVNKARLVEEFCSLAAVDALSYQEREIADRLKSSLEELGFDVKEDAAGKNYSGNAGNVYGYLPGEIEGAPLLFSAHMDTVAPGRNKRAIINEDGRITSDGSTVLGADDLSGIVAILEAIKTIKDLRLPHRSIEVLFTIAEEVYIKGSEVFDYTMLRAREAYVLDLSGPVGTAAIKAPTLVSFSVKIIGKASHAGFAPELGINAIATAAEVITGIRQGRIDEDTTVNIGLIEGGTSRNIVSDKCIFKGEIRSLNHEKALDEMIKVKDIIHNITIKYNAEQEVSTEFGCLAYEVDKEHQVVKNFEKSCIKAGCNMKLIETFGGSDNNNFLRHGITGIVIACGMNQVHSSSEYSHIDELIKCSKIVLELMTQKENEY